MKALVNVDQLVNRQVCCWVQRCCQHKNPYGVFADAPWICRMFNLKTSDVLEMLDLRKQLLLKPGGAGITPISV